MRFAPLLPVLALAWPVVPPAAFAADPLPGHSIHGEAFDKGPRQAAVIMDGCGKVDFPITTKNEQAQRFFLQGVAQLHGFWYFEAERSFRQVAALDPDCAMAYWGCAMANVNNEKRAAEFIKKAVDRKAQASPKEQAWIGSLENFYKDLKKDKKQRSLDFIKAIEDIISDHPQDLEAKAFLAWAIWESKSDGVTMVSREAVDAVLSQVFAKEPMHPARHYTIHLWDDSKPARAVEAATLCGQSAPAIAHMWHMPGHTFSKVDRLPDAAWQQDAATRVDHAYMIRTQVLPDQIHNYAHNTEWLVRSFNQLGRAHEALAQAKNLVEIPRHPEYNDRDNKNKSAGYGRTRMLETLLTWELWDDLLNLEGSPYLDVGQNPSFEANRLRALGVAAYFKGDKYRLGRYLKELNALPAGKAPAKPEPKKEETPLAKTDAKPAVVEVAKPAAEPEPAPAAASEEKTTAASAPVPAPATPVKEDEVKPVAKTSEPPAPASTAPKTEELKKDAAKPAAPAEKGNRPDFTVKNAKAELTALVALLEGKPAADVQKLLGEVKDNPKERLIRYQLALGDKEKAATLAQQLPMDAAGLCLRVDALVQADKVDEAKKHFEKLRKTAGFLDPDVPISARIDAIATQFGAPQPWRRPEAPRTDSGVRPSLDTLGPLHWHPFPATPFVLPDEANHPVSSQDFAGKPTIVLFYLGHTCTHCMEQLKAFTDAAKSFNDAGIELVAIGSEEPVDLTATAETCRAGGSGNGNASATPIRLLADPEQRVFKEWRCYDDFEGMGLHGAFLLDAKGQIRWLDVSPDPFTNTKFLLEEAKRLLRFDEEK